MWGVFNPNIDVVAALLKAGADVNAKDRDGKTALDYVRKNKDSAVAKLLEQAGGK